ncbi:MAG: efflux RND transporter periplasmic adaptor subunit [Planctomycetota bacterium]|jgi:membrane fusion protein (multidrug efflux system)|nr:MAG: efflux RND transporter periplasmic adaptor subunit [Planctomycetota bacterium]
MKVPKYYIVVLAAIGCGSPNNYVAPPPPEVTVASPVQQAVTEHLEFSGMTQPVETVEIRARVRGFLKERRFVEGSEVGKGDLLLVIDEEPFQIALEASQTRLKEAEAALEQATGSKAREVAQAQVNLSQSRVVLAQQEEKRVRSLFQKNVSPQAEMDKLSAELKAREAELESGKANFSETEATYDTKILACRAQLESAAIAVRSAELDLSYCRMTAPISGRISRSNVDVGNLIESTGATVLATIVRMEPIYAYATISEADLQRIPALRGMTVAADGSAMSGKLPLELGLASESDFPKSGEIDYMDPGLDPDTGTLRIRGVFPNADRSLLPGMFVRMRLAIAERADALLIPERALGTDQSGQYVLAVDAAGLVQYRSVKTGVAVGGMRVVDGEIAITDQVIVEGLLRARPGSKVVPKNAVEPTPTAEKSDAAQVAK